MAAVVQWLIANPRLAGALALAIAGGLYWLYESGKLPNVLTWFKRPVPPAEDKSFDDAFAALDVLAKVATDKTNTRLQDLCADMADELTHAFYPRRSA